MDWIIHPTSETPPSRQLVETVLDGIARGELVVGAQLPSVRRLAVKVLVNPNTVARAYRDLEALGVVKGQNGRGVFVTTGAPQIAIEKRLESTLVIFRRAACEALRTGHTPESLLAILSEEHEPEKRESA